MADPAGASEAVTPQMTAADAGALLDTRDDPVRLRRRLAQMAGALPTLCVPDAGQLEEDLREVLRRLASSSPRNPSVARRRRALEVMVSGAASVDAAAATLHMSVRSFYRYRREALDELALALTTLWRERVEIAAVPVAARRGEEIPPEGIPRPRVFVGRDADLRAALALLRRDRLLVIGGPAGIGKTAFGAALAQEEALLSPVLWHRFRVGLTDTAGGVLFAIGQRLSQLGTDALVTFLRQTSALTAWQPVALSLATHALQEHRMTLVFDDGDAVAGNVEVCGLLATLFAECPGCRVAVMARERMPLLQEASRFELAGLDAASVRAFLKAEGLGELPEAALLRLIEETGGGPHLVHLAAGAILHGKLDPARLEEELMDVPDVRAFFFDHIYRNLSQGEQVVLGATALMRQPASASFLTSVLEGLTPSIPSTLADLGRRFLLTETTGGLRLHSSVREFARRILPPGETAELHRHLARGHARGGRFDEACHHWIEAGELEEARHALLANPTDLQPHVQARLLSLVERLRANGLQDSELDRFAAELGATR